MLFVGGARLTDQGPQHSVHQRWFKTLWNLTAVPKSSPICPLPNFQCGNHLWTTSPYTRISGQTGHMWSSLIFLILQHHQLLPLIWVFLLIAIMQIAMTLVIKIHGMTLFMGHDGLASQSKNWFKEEIWLRCQTSVVLWLYFWRSICQQT